MALESNIFFSIGTKLGPGGLASLQSGLQMLGQINTKVAENIKDLDRFAQVYRNLKIDISQADAASRSLIDTLVLMAQTNKMSAVPSLGLTAEKLKYITLMTTAFAKETGQNATEVFKNFTQALLSGSTEVFRPYGIIVEGITGIMNVQAEVMRQVTARAKELNVKIENFSEGMFAVKNNWETTIGLVWTDMTTKNDLLRDAVKGVIDMLGELNTALQASINAERQMKIAEDIAFYARRKRYMEQQGLMEEAALAQEKLNALYAQYQSPYGDIPGPAGVKVTYAPQSAIDKYNKEKEKKKKTPKVAPGRPTEAAISQVGYAEMQAEIDFRLSLMEYESGMIEMEHERRFISFREHLQMEHQARMHDHTWELEQLQNNEQYRANIKAEWRMQDEIAEEMSALRTQYLWEQHWDFRLEKMQQFFAAGAGLQHAAMALQHQMDRENDKAGKARNKKMKTLWMVGKAAALGEITVNTGRAIMGAWASLSPIPFIGPYLAGAMAIIAGATGALQFALVKRQTFEGAQGPSPSSSSITTSSALGGVGGGSAPSYQQPPGSQPQEVLVTINMGDNALFMDAMIEANDNASKTRRPHFTRLK